MTTDLRKSIIEKFTLPFSFDKEGGYIFDADMRMVGEVRSWWYLQQFEQSQELQDGLGELIAEGLNIVFK
jgi:hypothetical protein